jgi:hypothetical protein
MSEVILDLPRYKSHKIVGAAKITVIGDASADGSRSLGLALLDGTTDTVVVDAAWLTRNPAIEVGGYFVQYVENADGYTSFSPAEPLESGYTLLGDIPPNATVAEPVNVNKCGIYPTFDSQAELDAFILTEAEAIRQNRDRIMAAQSVARRSF